MLAQLATFPICPVVEAYEDKDMAAASKLSSGRKARMDSDKTGRAAVVPAGVLCLAGSALAWSSQESRQPRDSASLSFAQPLPGSMQSSSSTRTGGLRGSLLPKGDAATSMGSTLMPAMTAVVGACLASSRTVTRKSRVVNVQRQGGSVETRKFLGDWAALAPSAVTEGKDAAQSARKLSCQDLPGIMQIRGVYPDGIERYGEEYAQNAGSTDNAYLIKPSGNQPQVLVGVHDGVFADEFIDSVKSALDNLGYLVLQYYDGKQLETVQKVIEGRPANMPPLKIFCAQAVEQALQSKLPAELLDRFEIVVVDNNTTLEIEQDRVMKFVVTPTPKTPEGIVAFDPVTGTLFSGKFFSAHKMLTDTCNAFDHKGKQGWEEFADHWFHLFDCYFFTENAQDAIRELFRLAEALHGPDVQQLAPLHGPVVREQCWKLMAKYEAWTEQKLRADNKRDAEVLVMYASAYGHTKTMAMSIADGLRNSDCRVNLLNLEHISEKEVSAALERCSGFFMGSPTLGGEMPTQVKGALGVVLSAASSEDTERVPCGVFGSYGWSGEAVDELHFRLKDGGFPFACDPLRARFRPTTDVLELCKEAGVRMSQKLMSVARETLEKRSRDIDPQVANQASLAFSKMRNSKCVISTKTAEGDDKVFPVSWVNQASFDPPAITVSMAKTDLDPFLSSSLDEQMEVLFNRYDVDGGGTLDREEIVLMLRELFGVRDEKGAELVQSKIDDALEILDENGDGDVDIEELREAAQDGPLATLLDNQRKLLALEEALGKSGDGKGKDSGLPFVLSLLPADTPQEALDKPTKHKKAKPTNKCFVHADCNAYIECAVTEALNAGDHTLLYAKVLNGKVMKDNELTDLIANTLESGNEAGALSQETKTPEVAMAAQGRRRASAAAAPSERSAFVGSRRQDALHSAAGRGGK